jgi:chaperonin cofactor prefoldin
MVKLTRTIAAVVIVAVAVAASGAYAGYFHDQSIKGVYSDLIPQIYQLKNELDTRDGQISSLKAQITDLANQASNLNGQISALNSGLSSLQQQNGQLQQQIATLQQQVYGLQQQVSKLQTTIDGLQAQLAGLQAPSMDGVFTFTGGGCFFGCSATVRGAWVNYGTSNARNVVVTLTWSKAGAFVQNNTINVGVVAGRSIGLFPDTNYNLASQADHLDWSFTFTDQPVSITSRCADLVELERTNGVNNASIPTPYGTATEVVYVCNIWAGIPENPNFTPAFTVLQETTVNADATPTITGLSTGTLYVFNTQPLRLGSSSIAAWLSGFEACSQYPLPQEALNQGLLQRITSGTPISLKTGDYNYCLVIPQYSAVVQPFTVSWST